MRPDWDPYFLKITQDVSTRAECTRRKVGALLVKDHRIVSSGYNGAKAGSPSCLEGACPRGLQTYDEVPLGSSYDTGAGACIAIHAEANALLYADRARTEGAVLYVNEKPCDGCQRLIDNSGVARVVYGSYENYEVLDI